MKRHILVPLLIAAALLLSGCISGGGDQTATTAPPTTAAPTAQPTTQAPTTTVPPTTAAPAATIREAGDHGDIPWQQYDDAYAKARDMGGYVFMYFWRDQCVFCNSMSSSTFIDPEVVAYLDEHFGIVDVDIWSDESVSKENPSLSGSVLNSMFRPPGVPAMAVLDADGNVIIGISGYKSSAELLATLEYVVSGSYADMTLQEYLSSTEAG